MSAKRNLSDKIRPSDLPWSHRPAGDLEGHGEYLWATLKYWPELITSLHAEVLPEYRHLVTIASPAVCASELRKKARFGNRGNRGGQYASSIPQAIARWSTLRNSGNQNFKALIDALTEWGRRFDVRDDWMFEVALGTLRRWDCPTPKMIWAPVWGLLTELSLPLFSAKFDQPYWSGWETRQQFEKRMLDQFKSQLRAYSGQTRKLYSQHRVALSADAEWTALFQRGESTERIARDYPSRRKYTGAYVRKQVTSFAKEIGLTLRPATRGPSSHIKTKPKTGPNKV